MKLNPKELKRLVAAIEMRRVEEGLSVSALAEASGVEQSQTSRICTGQFASIGSNVMQICITLGLHPQPNGVLLSNALAVGLASLWDGSKEDEERLLNLLKAIAMIKAG
ncbi:XRE family transcriptional regulator [Brucella pseudogrignonensis]|uniref:XRE family transcriptional regulator n=1 Tax=Brucella pseudogrignonensis TaxID=419475 RepID=A0A7Y3TA62_9HYPH|nr:helix-turn-helix transcriptional regulator [Brucella pseudogrignonensis]MCM0751650.1 XRE family transcriptional regulator [Brucella pseudogrignonensis]NNV21977.1 XRE family transcriptional regulator [Brucella pseudogrignonensis]